MQRSRTIRWLIALALAGWVGSWAVGFAWAAETATSTQWAGTQDQQKQWREGLAFVQTGEFEKGAAIIRQLSAADVKDNRIEKVEKWLREFDALQAARAERREADHGKYRDWVKEDMAAGNWIRAIAECALAFDSADDEEKFRQEPWVLEAVEGALKEARGYEKDGKWYKAARIHVQLEEIFPRDLQYRDAYERCQEHIRLELSYTPTSDWEGACVDITPDMAVEAFKRIYLNYIKEVSFQKLAESALKQLVLMTETPKLSRVFKNLSDQDTADEFRERIGTLLDRIGKEGDLSWMSMRDIFNDALKINKETGLFPQEVLIREFVHGTLKPLDQFSDMLWPADTEEFNKHTQGVFTGVGISIRKGRGEPIKVISPLEDTPAYEAGVQPGDLITHINGKPAAPMTITKAVQTITGPPGTSVTLTIKRANLAEPFDLKLVRAEITIYSVKGCRRLPGGTQWDFLLDGDSRIGYIRVTNFTDKTAQEIDDAMKSLIEKHRAKGVILDLRGNPGGLLKAAVEVTNLFLSGEKEIVSTRDRRGKDVQMYTVEPDGDHYPDIPLIVLVNPTSASASEIVAGALQVHHRAWILGERTFGKGSVQQVLPLTMGRQAYLKLTTARYFLPNGRCLHRDDDSETWGVDPNVAMPLVPKEMINVMNMRTRQEIVKGRNQQTLTEDDYKRVLATRTADREDEPGTTESQNKMDLEGVDPDLEAETKDQPPREDKNDWPEIDPQLDAALLLMRVHVISDEPWPTGTEAVAARPSVEAGS